MGVTLNYLLWLCWSFFLKFLFRQYGKVYFGLLGLVFDLFLQEKIFKGHFRIIIAR